MLPRLASAVSYRARSMCWPLPVPVRANSAALIADEAWIAVMVSTIAMAWRRPSPSASPLTLIMPDSACSTGS